MHQKYLKQKFTTFIHILLQTYFAAWRNSWEGKLQRAAACKKKKINFLQHFGVEKTVESKKNQVTKC